MKPGEQRLWTRLQQAALHEVDAVIQALPGPLKDKARSLPVLFEPAPSRDLVDDGLEPDTLGLFVGEPYGESMTGIENVPSQIILFLENLWLFCQKDTPAYREEVRITYLHELGHYLGLDEDDLYDRHLD